MKINLIANYLYESFFKKVSSKKQSLVILLFPALFKKSSKNLFKGFFNSFVLFNQL